MKYKKVLRIVSVFYFMIGVFAGFLMYDIYVSFN